MSSHGERLGDGWSALTGHRIVAVERVDGWPTLLLENGQRIMFFGAGPEPRAELWKQQTWDTVYGPNAL